MRTISWKAQGTKIYDCSVLVDDEQKQILKIRCQCWNFLNRQIKPVGKFAYKKYYATPCKHLKKVTEALENIGYNFKIPHMEGTQTCLIELRRQLIKRSNGICERLHCNNQGIDVHRIIPGHSGGLYHLKNCKFLCKDCHKVSHSQE